jgi:hypothetical protein
VERTAEYVPVEVEHGLSGTGADEHHQPVLVQPGGSRSVSDEIEHPFSLLRVQRRDVPEGFQMTLRNDEEMYVGLGRDVLDGDESVGPVDEGRGQLSADDAAEDAVGIGGELRQRGSPPL